MLPQFSWYLRALSIQCLGVVTYGKAELWLPAVSALDLEGETYSQVEVVRAHQPEAGVVSFAERSVEPNTSY